MKRFILLCSFASIIALASCTKHNCNTNTEIDDYTVLIDTVAVDSIL